MSSSKAATAERSIRTLRSAFARYWEASGNRRWVDYLPIFLRKYNDTPSTVTKQRPIDMAVDVFALPKQPKTTKGLPRDKRVHPVGTLVRLSKEKGIFDKEYIGNYSREVFRVARIKTIQGTRPLLLLEDMEGEPILGGLYMDDVTPVEWDGKMEVETILAQRRRQKKLQYLIKFKGWPPKFNVWLDYKPLPGTLLSYSPPNK